MTMTHQTEGVCPVCYQKMIITGPIQYHCPQCQTNYSEQVLCPTCGHPAERLQACGAVNYLCIKDGLLSKSKLEYRYLLVQ